MNSTPNPAVAASSASARPWLTPQPGTQRPVCGRIRVVDDDPDVREALEAALELEGHRVQTAGDGVDALSKLARSSFDAVVLDVLMPNLDGFDVCRRVRAAGDPTPILIATARDAEKDCIRGLDLGADD